MQNRRTRTTPRRIRLPAPRRAYNSYASSGFPNLLRFGIVSSTTVGGSFDVDYLRWATDGTWDYKGPPEAFVMVVR